MDSLIIKTLFYLYGVNSVNISNQGCHCQLDVKFKDFSRTFSNKFKDLRYQLKRTILKSFIILYINSAMSFTRFASWENRASAFVSKHCYIEGIMCGCGKQLILIIFCSKRWKILPIPEFSRTATQNQGLSRAWNFLLPIPELSRIFKDRGNPVQMCLTTYIICFGEQKWL